MIKCAGLSIAVNCNFLRLEMKFLLVLLVICCVVIRSTADCFSPLGCEGMFSHLFTAEEIDEISTNKRVRREIRDLTCDQWSRVAAAMNIMKYVSEEEGQEIYGSDYRSYDSLICQHVRGTHHTLGDMMHLGPHFLVTHRAFVLAFENSLIAIDPRINGAPYWNYYIDVEEYGNDLTDSTIFNDRYFGSFSGDESFNHVVSNGKFKFWKVNDDPNLKQCNGSYRNAFGLLRQVTTFSRLVLFVFLFFCVFVVFFLVVRRASYFFFYFSFGIF